MWTGSGLNLTQKERQKPEKSHSFIHSTIAGPCHSPGTGLGLLYLSSPSSHRLCNRDRPALHFGFDLWGSKRLSDLPKVTQLLRMGLSSDPPDTEPEELCLIEHVG